MDVDLLYQDGTTERVTTPARVEDVHTIKAINVISEEYEFCGSIAYIHSDSIILVRSKPVKAPLSILSDEERVREVCNEFGLTEIINELWDDNTFSTTPEQLIIQQQINTCIETRQVKGLRQLCILLKECLTNNTKQKDGVISLQIDLLLQHFQQTETDNTPTSDIVACLRAYNMRSH